MVQSWLETHVEVPDEAADAAANYLIELGSPGLVSEEKNGRTRLTAYFEHEEQVEKARVYAAALADGAGVTAARISSQNWAENWKEHFPPIAVGEKLFLCPPWAATPPVGRHAIVIDPGMAFGTGHHITTRACLELLEPRLRRGDAVLDVGTGSGILSIAALLLGASRAVGIDTDALATEAAAANAVRNGVDDRLRLGASLGDVDSVFDTAVANIQLNILSDLEPLIAARVRPGGTLIASGLLRHQLDAWRRRYAANWDPGETAGDEEWAAIAATRRSTAARPPWS